MEKRARTLVIVKEGDLSFFCPYEPGAKEKRKADRNTDNRPTLSAFRASFYFFPFAHAATAAKFQIPPGGESETPARRTTAPYPSPPKSDGAAQRPPSLPSPPKSDGRQPEPSTPTPLPPQSPSPSSPKPSPPALRSPRPKTSHASGSHSH